MKRHFPIDVPVHLGLTLAPLRHGGGDPTIRVTSSEASWASRTPDGPGALHMTSSESEVTAEAWGPGAEWLLEHAPGLVGADDDPRAFDPPPGIVDRLHRRNLGLRCGRSGRVFEALLPVILGQVVATKEAHSSYRRLVAAWGEPAPGPTGLMLQPEPARIAAAASEDFHSFGIARNKADTIRRAAHRAPRLEEAVAMTSDDARRRLTALRGIGVWSAAFVAWGALGDADAVPYGDYHLPNAVSFLLAGEPRGNDGRMRQLLEPYAPHRGRVVRLVKAAGVKAPRYGPRRPLRSIEHI